MPSWRPSSRPSLVHDGAGLGGAGAEPLDHAGIAARGHEADVLAVGLARDREAEARRLRPHPLLGEIAEGEAQEVELRRGGGEEEVALVPAAIDRAVQLGPGGAHDAPRIVAGGERVRAEIAGERQQVAELDALVAAHAGDRRLAAQVGLGEVLDHRFAEARLVVEDVVADAEPVRDPAGVVDVLAGAAGAGPGARRAVRIEAERDAHDLVARLGEQGGGDRRIDAARHRHRDARLAPRPGDAEVKVEAG